MRLMTGEYKRQELHSRYNSSYYTFTPQLLTNEKLWVEDSELAILTAKTYKLLGVIEGLIEYAPNIKYISTWLKTKDVYYSLLIDNKTKEKFTDFYRLMHKENDVDLQKLYRAYNYALNNPFNNYGLSIVYNDILNDNEVEELCSFRQEPMIWCEVFTSSMVYNPTDPSEIPELYKDMVDFLYSNEIIDNLAKSAILHYQFEMIKPFYSYNGFLGRLLFTMIPNQAGFSAISYIAFFEYLFEHREDYFKILSSTQVTGDYLSLIKYIVRGMLTSSERCIDSIKKLEETMLMDEMKIRNSKQQTKGMLDVYEYFKRHLNSDIKSVSEDLGLSYNTASKAVDLFIKLKILNIETVQARHKKFRYTKVLKILNET